MGASMGIFPYRLDVDTNRKYYDNSSDSPAINLIEQIKKAIDPKNIISSGRYTAKTKETN